VEVRRGRGGPKLSTWRVSSALSGGCQTSCAHTLREPALPLKAGSRVPKRANAPSCVYNSWKTSALWTGPELARRNCSESILSRCPKRTVCCCELSSINTLLRRMRGESREDLFAKANECGGTFQVKRKGRSPQDPNSLLIFRRVGEHCPDHPIPLSYHDPVSASAGSRQFTASRAVATFP
jgi:hypothetical protein